MTTRIPTARAAALLAIHTERERQDVKHGFDPTRPTGFGRWWAPLLDRALHWLYERAKRRGRLTWGHTLVEEVGEVLAARTPADAVKELREVAAVCVKVEEALVASGQVPSGEVTLVQVAALVPISSLRTATEAFRRYAATMPRDSRTVADCQALLGAMNLAQMMGADMDALFAVENPAELGATIARLSRSMPPAGGVQ